MKGLFWRLAQAIVLVVFSFFVIGFSNAGETKNELILDCNHPGDDAVTCLACNIYHEARSESTPGLWLVALATKNRVDGKLYPLKNAGPKVKEEGFTNDFCKVVYEQRRDRNTKRLTPMFSWTLDGKHDRVYNADMWYDALEVATKTVAWYEKNYSSIIDITFGCQWYHHISIEPYWMKSYHPTVRIGAHQCYSQNEEMYLEKLDMLMPAIGLMKASAAVKKTGKLLKPATIVSREE